MKPVVEVEVGHGVARRSPLEYRVDVVVQKYVDAPVSRVSTTYCEGKGTGGYARGPDGVRKRSNGAIHEVHEVLLRNGASARRPSTTANNGSIHL